MKISDEEAAFIAERVIVHAMEVVAVLRGAGVTRVRDLPDIDQGHLRWIRRAVWGDAEDEASSVVRERLQEMPRDEFMELISDPEKARQLGHESYRQLASELSREGRIALTGSYQAERRAELICSLD